MQRAEKSSARAVPEPASTRPGLSPPIAFGVLLSVLVLLGAIVFLTRPDAPPPTTAPTQADQPNFALTDEEAITRFEELDQLRHQAFAEVDPSLLPLIYSDDSDVLEIAGQELVQLRADQVRDESTFRTLSLKVLENAEGEVTLEQVVTVEPHFVSAKGRDVTTGPKLIRRKVLWTLVLRAGSWLIEDSVIEKARVVRA